MISAYAHDASLPVNDDLEIFLRREPNSHCDQFGADLGGQVEMYFRLAGNSGHVLSAGALTYQVKGLGTQERHRWHWR
jgi:hypothetical protein